ncbi:MAG: hypothetical protein AAFR14_12095, partial [Bacteroidota bacterium]
QLFNRTTRNILVSVITVGLVFYCLSNYLWDIPHKDFRDFKVDRNIAERKALEQEAMANTQILAYKMENKETGEKVELPYVDYLANYKSYPSAEWDLEQIYDEPTVKETKISEFDIFDLEGNIVNDAVLDSEQPVLMIVAHKLYADGTPATQIVKDTIYQRDSILQSDGTYIVEQNISRVDERTETYTDYLWKDYYAKRYTEVVVPFIDDARKAGVGAVAVVGGADNDQIRDLATDLKINAQLANADDVLLKTIVRSNPGVVLFKDGTILQKWHHRKLPSFEEVRKQYLR